MNSVKENALNQEYDLHELFFCIWAYKLLILLACLVGIGYGGYIGINAQKKYASTVVFRMTEQSNASSQTASLSSIVGFPSTSRAATVTYLKNKIRGRVFIESLNEDLDFFSDSYLNNYNPNRKNDPLWKSIIKKLLGYQNVMPDPLEAGWQAIVREFNNNMEIDVARNKTITISIYHNNANRASKIANTLMNKILDDDRDQKALQANFQLNFLTNAIADALTEIEIAQSNLQAFAITNTAIPQNDFELGSVKLEALRDLLKRTNDLLFAATALELVLNKVSYTNLDYIQLSKDFPVVDQVEFRRALGLSEVISSWSWPEKSTVTAVIDTLRDRSKKLTIEITSSQKDVELISDDLFEYEKLVREQTIADAKYTVLIKQAEKESLTDGLRADSSKIFQKATTPIFPSEPRRDLYILLGALVGLFSGVIISFIIASFKKVYYTKNKLMEDAKALYVANVRKLKFLRKLQVEQIKKKIIKNPQIILSDLILEIHKSSKKFVVVSTLQSKFKSVDLASMVASHMQYDDVTIAIINFSKKNKPKDTNNNIEIDIANIFISYKNDENISFLEPKDYLNPLDFLSQHNFSANMQSLLKKYDLIFLCADDNNSISVGRAMQFQEVFHIISVRAKHTKIENLTQICKILPIQGLLYD